MGSPAENISSSKVNIARQASVRVTKQGRDGSAGGHQQELRVDQPGRPVLVPGANPDEVKGQVAVKNWARGLAPRTHFLRPAGRTPMHTWEPPPTAAGPLYLQLGSSRLN